MSRRGSDPTQDHLATTDRLLEVLHALVPASADAPPGLDLPLDGAGFGLDSVGLVELLVTCEARFGVPFPDALLQGGPLTLRRLVRHVHASSGEAGDGAV